MPHKKTLGNGNVWMMPDEAAADMGCHVATVYRNAGKNGVPKLRKVFGRWKFKRAEWENYMQHPPIVRETA